MNLLAIDLPGIDPDVNVGLLGVAMNDREGSTARELALQPLLGHAEGSLVRNVPLETRRHPVVGSRLSPRAVLRDLEVLSRLRITDQGLSQLVVVARGADVVGELIEENTSFAVDDGPFARDVCDVSAVGAGRAGPESKKASASSATLGLSPVRTPRMQRGARSVDTILNRRRAR
jgi:hypothetical protein